MPPPAEVGLYLGRVLDGRFGVNSFLNEGGFCLVFRGTDHQSNTEIAIKILKQGVGAEGVIEFENEGDLLKLLERASNVVTAFHSGTDVVKVSTVPPGAVIDLPVRFLVLELADASLDEIVVRRHGLSFGRRLGLFRHVALGIHQMHLSSVVHRDVKSDNSLVFRRRGITTAKVNDLGRSRQVGEPPRFPALDYLNGRGDLRFAPPEALWGQLDTDPVCQTRADLYMLGSVLFELVTGQPVTALALGNGPAIAAWSRAVPAATRDADYTNRTADIGHRYETAFQLFANETPAVIRQEATTFLRQLCNPNPHERDRRHRVRLPLTGLEWVLVRTDILIRRLMYAERQAADLAAKKHRRGTS